MQPIFGLGMTKVNGEFMMGGYNKSYFADKD